MKIVVAVKRTIDYNVRVRIKADGSGVDTAGVKMSINPFDEIALEEALRFKKAGLASEVIAVSAGAFDCQETLRAALAMGADRALLLQTDKILQPLAVAKLLRWVVQQELPQLVLLGKQAIDDDCNQTGQMLAALLNWPQATFVSKVEMQAGSIKATREVDNGLEELLLQLPAVITTDLRLNQPRYTSLPNIMKAKSKPLSSINADELGIDIEPRLKIKKLETPKLRKTGVLLNSAAELVDKLRNEAKVI